MKCFHNLFVLLLGLEGTKLPSSLVLEGVVLSDAHRHCRNARRFSIFFLTSPNSSEFRPVVIPTVTVRFTFKARDRVA